MNGVSRFLSRRDKHHEKRSSRLYGNRSHIVPSDLYAIFSKEQPKPAEKEDDKKVKALVQRLHAAGITAFTEAQASYALSMYPTDPDQAYDVLVLANDSFEGILSGFDPSVKMLGAVNRNMVTCYLDALLFAMFARLDSFEAMLFDNFSDEPRKKLAGILRLWINLLRTGRLIGAELTKHLQDALANCGWEGAAEVRQQDASEAFTFITGALELPLLTLKMDIYHTGREDQEDDHKFVNERLLEVAIPEQEGDKVTTLEDCLEAYFNNRIEVKRYLQRQNTMGSMRSTERDPEKSQTIHIESLEIPESASSSPIVSTPTSLYPATPSSPIRPTGGRRRADSIFTERYRTEHAKSDENNAFDEKRHLDELWKSSSQGRPRSTSLRKEVLMPAWQFFSLIPWYTDNVPQSDAQVAAHFSAKRPVLGICLKRYMMLPDGTPKRLDTYIDIPLEIGLPHFVSDDRIEEMGPLFGNFKLVLQSVVCHRGVRVDSGHYISLVRANKSPHSNRPRSSKGHSEELSDSWLRFDDLSPERVTEVDITQALKEESPYLLFFQVQPIDEELASRGDPPSYSEVQSLPGDPSMETLSNTSAAIAEQDTNGWEKVGHLDTGAASDGPTGRSSMSSYRRSSVTIELEGSIESLSRGRTAPPTPAEDKVSFLSTSRRNSKAASPSSNSKSRPSSQSGENRLSLTLSRLTGRGSKDKLQITENNNSSTNTEEPLVVVNTVKGYGSAENDQDAEQNSSVKEQKQGSGVGRSKSRREKGKEKEKEKKKLRSKSRDIADMAGRNKNRPDRECLVM